MNTEKMEKQVEVSVPEYKPRPQATLDAIQEAANEVYEIEMQIKAIEEEYKNLLKPLEDIKDERRTVLLQMMQEARQKHVDVDENHFYTKEIRSSFEVVDEESAMKWAKKQGLVRIDKVQANKVLLRIIKTPKGFTQIDNPFLKLNTSKK